MPMGYLVAQVVLVALEVLDFHNQALLAGQGDQCLQEGQQ